MKLEGSFSGLLHGRPPPRSHSTATSVRGGGTSSECKCTPWTGLAPRGILNSLTLSRSPLSAMDSIFLLIRKGLKGLKFHLRQWLRGQRRERARWLIFMCIYLVDISMHLTIINPWGRQREGRLWRARRDWGELGLTWERQLSRRGQQNNTRNIRDINHQPHSYSPVFGLWLLKHGPWNLRTHPQSGHLHL